MGMLLFGICYFITACQEDEIESSEVYTTKQKEFIKVNLGNDVTGKVIDFLNQRTNNSMKVNVTKGHVKLFNGNMENARQSAMGEVDTSKEIVVVNENNTKYTYKVNTVEETSTSVTNIIVVDTGDELFEYFIKYNFDNEIPMHEAGVVDISRFTGTIETYNSEGQLTGVTEIVNGSVVNGSGTSTPCPDDANANDDPVGDDSDGTGGAQGSVGDDDPNNPNDDGGGGWFDGGPDWDCGLNYHYDECTGGASDLHEPRENSSLPGGMCSGTLLIITDCEGNVISSSGVFARNTESTDTTNPCGGSAGVIIDDGLSRECRKIEKLLNDQDNQVFKDKLLDLASPDNYQVNLDVSFEKSASIFENQTNLVQNQGNANQGSVPILLNPNNKYKAFVHTHPNDANGTYSVFSFDDLIAISKILYNNKINTGTFVAFLISKKGANVNCYALTINNKTKFKDFFYAYQDFDFFAATQEEKDKRATSWEKSRNLRNTYYDNNSPLITNYNIDSEEMLKQFLKFMKEANMGATLFKTDASFDNFSQVTYDTSQQNDVNEKNCN